MKYNYTTLFNNDLNPIYAVLLETHNATRGFVTYLILLITFILLLWVFMQRTQDIGKSFASSGFAVMLLMLILFYAGKVDGVSGDLIPEILMLGVGTLVSIGVAALYYMRSEN